MTTDDATGNGRAVLVPEPGSAPATPAVPVSEGSASEGPEAHAPAELSAFSRVGVSLGVLGLVAGFATAGLLRANPSGQGTHTQLGLPPCAAKLLLGVPCPSCGMTTSLTYFTQLRWRQSFATHPIGPVVGLASLAAIVLGTIAAVRGRWTFRLGRHRPGPLATAAAAIWIINGLLLARWVVRYWL